MAKPVNNKPSTSGKEPIVPVTELRATIAKMLKEALGDHKDNKGKQKDPDPKGRMRDSWCAERFSRDATMLWTVVTMCFFGFLKAGEIVMPSGSVFDSDDTLVGWQPQH